MRGEMLFEPENRG